MPDKKRNTEERLAELLDNKYRIPGTNIRFGIDPIIGLVPGAGDVMAGGVSLYFLIKAALLQANGAVLARMFMNILMDVLVGSIPILGEAFDVYWKTNLRNARILEELQQHPQKTTSESRLWIWFVVVQFIAILIAIILLIGWLIAEAIGLLIS